MDKAIERLNEDIKLTYDKAILNGRLHAYAEIIDDIKFKIEELSKEISELKMDIDSGNLDSDDKTEALDIVNNLSIRNNTYNEIITLIMKRVT